MAVRVLNSRNIYVALCNNVVFFTLLSFGMPIFVHREICKKYKFSFEKCIVGARQIAQICFKIKQLFLPNWALYFSHIAIVA